jgi:hypothetical protein
MLAIAASAGALALTGAVGVSASMAMFSDSKTPGGDFGTKAIFPGERVTPAFAVGDTSAGASSVDRSSAFAVAADGRTVTTSAWSSAVAATRYLDIDMNTSLPGGLTASSAVFRFRFASTGASATACVYLEVRSKATDTVLATYGNSGSPQACVTGTTLTTTTTSVPIVGTTDRADDLRVHVFGRDSAGGGMTIDEARVTGSTAYVAFSLYPVRYADVADTTPDIVPWALAGP